MRAIQVDDTLAVFPIFALERVTRLTTKGMESVDLTSCTILDAGTLNPLAQGLSMRAPEDTPDNFAGAKYALERALESSFFTKDQRAKIWDAFEADRRKHQPRKREAQLQHFRNLVRETMGPRVGVQFELIRGGRR